MRDCDDYLEYRVSKRGGWGLQRHQVGWSSLPGLAARLLHNQDLEKIIWDWEKNIQILFIILIKAKLHISHSAYLKTLCWCRGGGFIQRFSRLRTQVTQFNLIKAGIWVSPQCPAKAGEGPGPGSWAVLCVHLRGLNRDLYWHFSNFALSES